MIIPVPYPLTLWLDADFALPFQWFDGPGQTNPHPITGYTRPDGSPATGLTDVFAYLSDTDGELPVTPIAPQLIYPAVESGTEGTYAVTFAATDLEAFLPPSRVGRSGWIVIVESGIVLASDEVHFETSQRVTGT